MGGQVGQQNTIKVLHRVNHDRNNLKVCSRAEHCSTKQLKSTGARKFGPLLCEAYQRSPIVATDSTTPSVSSASSNAAKRRIGQVLRLEQVEDQNMEVGNNSHAYDCSV